MARAYKSRVEFNRKAFAALELAEADALHDVARVVLQVVDVPDAPPFGQGLREGGGAITYLGKKKVAATQIGGRDVSKPRTLRLKVDEVVTAVGFGFPGRFVELGTVDAPANPFLTRAVASVLPDAEVIISKTVAKRLAGIRSFGGRAK